MTAVSKPVQWDELEFEPVTEMVSRREISGGGQSLVQTYLRKGAIVPLHAHTGDQWITILKGRVRATVAGKEMTMDEGSVLRIPAGTPHELQSLDDSLVLDVRSGDLQLT